MELLQTLDEKSLTTRDVRPTNENLYWEFFDTNPLEVGAEYEGVVSSIFFELTSFHFIDGSNYETIVDSILGTNPDRLGQEECYDAW